ncbi:hypothetical protein SEUCBS139899_010642 [Sporothrix eucalyptigena]|uniref:3-hydroxyisobutyrate dehydrogenase n=1 Tax=Sporothrix eucalyptigena TaxID=1812306 RepID=A0ABP0BHM6_9PEZI
MATPVKLGFIGLGAMGFPMASNLISKSAKGSQLFIYDVSEASLKRFAEMHPDPTVVCKSPAEVSKSSDILFTMLPEGAHVKSVYLDPATGVLHDGMVTKILVDCSTIDVDTSLLVLGAVRKSHPDAYFFDAPVSGGTLGAEAGSITIMLGASEPEPAYPTLLALLNLMGNNIVPCGKPGMGLTAKLCNNYCSGLIALATAEAMNIGIRSGMDPRLLSRVFSSSTAQSTICDKWNPVPGVVPAAPSSSGYKGGFKVQLMAKDFGLAMQAAEKVEATTLLGHAGLDAYRKAGQDPNCRDLDSRVVFRYIGGDEKWQEKL